MVVQSIFALLLNAVVLGIVFARISRPAQRGRTIFLSDSAVIARRNGSLKFIFRVADIRPLHQVSRLGCPIWTMSLSIAVISISVPFDGYPLREV